MGMALDPAAPDRSSGGAPADAARAGAADGDPDVDLYDLRGRPPALRDAECRAFFDEVYGPSFPDPAIREEVDTWLELLAAEPVPPRPRLHVIVAAERGKDADERGRRIIAGFVCEYYARSDAALGTYMVVARDARRRGLAGRLLAHGQRVLAADAGRPGGAGPVLFAETEAPARSKHEPAVDVAARLAALARLGFLRCELPYVQPPLGPGKPPVDWLLLLVHAPSLAAGPGGGGTLAARTVEGFLRDFYESLGVSAPDEHGAFRAMQRWLAARDPVPLLPLESAGTSATGAPAVTPAAGRADRPRA